MREDEHRAPGPQRDLVGRAARSGLLAADARQDDQIGTARQKQKAGVIVAVYDTPTCLQGERATDRSKSACAQSALLSLSFDTKKPFSLP